MIKHAEELTLSEMYYAVAFYVLKNPHYQKNIEGFPYDPPFLRDFFDHISDHDIWATNCNLRESGTKQGQAHIYQDGNLVIVYTCKTLDTMWYHAEVRAVLGYLFPDGIDLPDTETEIPHD